MHREISYSFPARSWIRAVLTELLLMTSSRNSCSVCELCGENVLIVRTGIALSMFVCVFCEDVVSLAVVSPVSVDSRAGSAAIAGTTVDRMHRLRISLRIQLFLTDIRKTELCFISYTKIWIINGKTKRQTAN